MRMLIIDDSKTMRRYLSALASELAIETDEATDGQDALTRLGDSYPTQPFDVALVDWDMPRMNGVEFVKAVRREPYLDSLKLLMVTSHNVIADVRTAIAAGADDYLMKPLDGEMMASKLRLLGLLD